MSQPSAGLCSRTPDNTEDIAALEAQVASFHTVVEGLRLSKREAEEKKAKWRTLADASSTQLEAAAR